MGTFTPDEDKIKLQLGPDVRKVKIKSVYHDFKTGFFCKLFLILGFIFLIVYLIIFAIQSLDIATILDEKVMGTLLAFLILFLGFGFIFYFLSCQFAKLAKIAEEIENEEFADNSKKS